MKNKTKIFFPLLLSFQLFSCGPLNPFDLNEVKRIPSIQMITPASVGEPVDASFEIQLEFKNVVLGDTWSLYYVSDSSESMRGAIIEGFSVATRTITWETDDIPAGSYSFYAEMISLGSVLTATSPGSIEISHGIVDGNNPPTVSFSSQANGSRVTIDSATNVTWTSSDANGDTMTASLEYSDDNGNSWAELAASATSPYSWTPDSSYITGPNYRLRVTVEDANGSKTSARSGRFTVE